MCPISNGDCEKTFHALTFKIVYLEVTILKMCDTFCNVNTCIQFRKHFAKYILMGRAVYSSSPARQIFVFSNKQQDGERNTLATSCRFHFEVFKSFKSRSPATFHCWIFFPFKNVKQSELHKMWSQLAAIFLLFFWLTARNPFFCDKECCIFSVSRQNCVKHC